MANLASLTLDGRRVATGAVRPVDGPRSSGALLAIVRAVLHDDRLDERALLADAIDGLRAAGVRRVHVLAWRDLDDPDAGGSEAHADRLMRRWADGGLDVVHRTSAARGTPSVAERHGYRVIRRGGRFTVFPRAVLAEIAGSMGPTDAVVEVWNGVPWASPVWARCPNVTIVHHVHGPMWDQIFPSPLAACGRHLETGLAPRWYRRTPIVTPSESTREELLTLGFDPRRVTAVDNGVDDDFSPGGVRAPRPTVVTAARLAPVKRIGMLVDAVAAARERIPELELRVLGDGPARRDLDAWIAANDAAWVVVRGHVPRHEVVDELRRAWLVASASLAEGWGLALTEAAACGTPAVATDIPGHRSSVIHDQTGVLAPEHRLGDEIAALLVDHARRRRLGHQAAQRASTLSWDRTARGITEVLAVTARARGSAPS